MTNLPLLAGEMLGTIIVDSVPPPDEQTAATLARRPLAWIALGLVVLLLTIGLIALVHGDGERQVTTISKSPQQEGPPPAEPLVFAPIAAEAARKINDAVPFASDRGPAARPFLSGGSSESRERAADCLASAMWYEAGGDARGQRAVAQVVLNRVRHPAYPGTVCGVVFQGSERRTGCQFTFTCDGALRRVPPARAFALARERARAMLDGLIAPEVGLATHYHTDWVHPIWSARLEKIARVDTHLFFRWSGWWGGPGAHRETYHGGEPPIPALAFISPLHGPAPVATASAAPAGLSGGGPPATEAQDLGGGKFRVFMSAARSGNVQALQALEQCGSRDYCKLTGVLDSGTVVFVYLRNRRAEFERAMWDCQVFKRPTNTQCFGPERDIPDVPGLRLRAGAAPTKEKYPEAD